MIQKQLLTIILCLLVLPLSAQKSITILHTNDVHSRIEPISPNNPDVATAGKGGFLRIANYVEEVRTETDNLLIFDSGDFSQGTPYYTKFKGDVEIKLMNIIGYDAATIGNHEFDFGLDNMARLFRMANFPIVCANYEVEGTVLEGLIKPYIVITKNGMKIGVFGLSPQLQGLVQEMNYGDVKFIDPIETGNRVAKELKEKEKCDMIICISHLGYTSTSEDLANDVKLAKQSRNINLILGGHSHTFMEEADAVENLDGKIVTITQTGKSGIFVDRVDVTIK